MPDVSGGETSGGMKVEGVRKDGPAERSGMLKGDVIIAINGLPVSNIYDYMSRLGKLRAGERANIEVLRDGKKEVLIVQL
jgi:S1-C subfamily serine protease